MKEHKIMEALSAKKAEKIMDDMSCKGWEVVSVAFGGITFIITLAREIKLPGSAQN